MSALLATLPTNANVLFWTQAQRDAGFRALDRLPVLAKSHVVPASITPLALPPDPPLKLPLDVDAYMAGQRSAALIVLHDGTSGGRLPMAASWRAASSARAFSSTPSARS